MRISEQLDMLAAFEPTTLPVVSLYLNAQQTNMGVTTSPLSSGRNSGHWPARLPCVRPSG
jgi:hypothetical protein